MTKNIASIIISMTKEIEAVQTAMVKSYDAINHDSEGELFNPDVYAYDGLQNRFINMILGLMRIIEKNNVILSGMCDSEKIYNIDGLSVSCAEFMMDAREYVSSSEQNEPIIDYDDPHEPTVIYYVIQKDLEAMLISQSKEILADCLRMRNFVSEQYPEVAAIKRLRKEVTEEEYHVIHRKNVADGVIAEDDEW